MPTKLPVVSWPAEGLTRIPHGVYVDADIYAQEQERIFRGSSWNYVGLACELPRRGDFIRSFVGETPVIVVRDRDDRVNVVVNRCPHKGVQFCQEWSGTAAAFSCPYHQWTFNLKGDLTGMPFRKGVEGLGGFPADFDMAEHGLKKLAVVVRNGVIFASFASNMPSLETYFGPANLAYFDRIFDGRPLRILGKHRQRVATNWKTLVENFKDPYHATLLHVFFATFGIWRAGNETVVRIDETGGTSTLVQQSPVVLHRTAADDVSEEIVSQMKVYRKDVMKLADPTILDVVREAQFKNDDDTVTMQTVWPNCAIHQNLNSLGFRIAWPRGPNSIEIQWTFLAYEDDSPDMIARRLRHANFFGPAGLVTCDDLEVWQLNQRGLGTTPVGESCVEAGGATTESADFVITETAVRAFYKHYRSVMGL